MQNAALQYGEGVTPVQESPFGVTSMQNNSTSSSTSSLRQFRKKDNVDKTLGAAGGHSASGSRADSANSSHVARVAPHNHYPHKQNEYFRYPPQYQEYNSPYKEHTVKYSEIAEPVSQAIPHLEHLPSSVLSKHKEKDYPEMCNIPQQSHLNKPFSDHQYNGQHGYPSEMAMHHHQYMQKESQGPQMHSPYKPESQYIPKEGAFNHQISPFLKYNIPTQSRNYGHLENPSLGSFQRMDPHIPRTLMPDHPHIRDFPAEYSAMEQSRMYAQKQRYYPAPLAPTNPTYPPNYPHRNMPTQQYNYPNCNYPRASQVNSSMGRYPMNMERSMSPRRTYPENLDMGMNFPSVPQKISSTYPNYPAYAQHYQHRRPSAVPQEYYHHQQHPHVRSHPQYMPAHHPQEVAENHVASNNIRQYLENWAEEEATTEIPPQIDNPKYIPRINRDEANEVYVINASELPQYLESGVPLVTSENGQYIFKSNVSIDNTGAIKILEKTVENAVLPTDPQERVVSLHIIENPKADCLINSRTTNMNQEYPGSANQVPAATINVITTNTSPPNQENAVQHSYSVPTQTFNPNRMNLMHHIPPINQSGPQHNQHYENSLNLCLHPNVPEENPSSSRKIITPNTAMLEDNVRLSPHAQPMEKSLELSQKVQDNLIGDGIASEKNRLKIQILSYQEVPQNSCIVMPSSQNRLNFDESLLPNQVPSDIKGAKREFVVRNDDDSAISNVISSNENILNEAHEELDKIVEDTLTSSNINIPMVSCESDELPKIQGKCDTTNTIVNSRIPDDLNLDLESNPKDLTNDVPDYTMENNCIQENEDIIDLSTSRRGSKNDEQGIQSIELDLSISTIHTKLGQIITEGHEDLPILTEYTTATNQDDTTSIASEGEEISSPKSASKHMPLIDDNLEARGTLTLSEAVTSAEVDIKDTTEDSSNISKPVEKEKREETPKENYVQEDETEKTDALMGIEIPIVQPEKCDTSAENSPHSRSKEDTEMNNSLDTALEAKLSEIVGEPYQFPEKDIFIKEAPGLDKEENNQGGNDAQTMDCDGTSEYRTKTISEETVQDTSEETLKKNNDQVIEGPDVLNEKSAPFGESINENLPLKVSVDTPMEKKKEGSRNRRIFSVDDIIYRIGPNTVQNRRESIHSIPDSDCTVDSFLEETKASHLSNQGSKIDTNNDELNVRKKEETDISPELVENSMEILESSTHQSELKEAACEVKTNLQETSNIQKITDCNLMIKNESSVNPLSPAFTCDATLSCNDSNIPSKTSIENILIEEKCDNIEPVVSIENVKASVHEEITLNVDTPGGNSSGENDPKAQPSLTESMETETFQNDAVLLSEVESHLLTSGDIISVNRTSEFESLIVANFPERGVQGIEVETMDVAELPLLKNEESGKMDASEEQEPCGNAVKEIFNGKEVLLNTEQNENQSDSIDGSVLIISKPSDVKVEDDVQILRSKGEDSVTNANEPRDVEPKVSTLEFPELQMEEGSENVAENTVGSQNDDSSKESEIITPHISEAAMSKTEDTNENDSQPGSSFFGSRFSVIHKTEDSTRIFKQEETKKEKNNETNIVEIDVRDSKIQVQTTEECVFPELDEPRRDISTDVSDEKQVLPNQIVENSEALSQNQCSVIQSVEDIVQDEINKKTSEIVESETKEKCSDEMEFKDEKPKTTDNFIDTETTSMKILEDDAISEEPLKKSETSKHSSLSSVMARKEELTFEQKFVEPFCNKSEEKVQKTEEIDEKSPEEVQYRSVLKIEENNVLLEIGGELVEISVSQVNGKSVITVIPMSNAATVDFNDNYEHVYRSQLCEGISNVDLHEDCQEEEQMPVLREETREDVHKENEMKEELPVSTRMVVSSEDERTINRSADISSTQSDIIDGIFEDIILNENEIIIGDESLEEEINLDLQSRELVEEDRPKTKPVLCTKAAKKLYDDVSLQVPTKTYSSLREFRRIKTKPESSTPEYKGIQFKGKKSSKRSVRISARKRTVSEQKEGSHTALQELIERRKMRKEKIRLKYTQYAKQESRIVTESINTGVFQNTEEVTDVTKVPTVPSNVVKMERLPMTSVVKKVKTEDDLKRREFKKKMHRYKEKVRKKSKQGNQETTEQNITMLPKEKIVSSTLEIERKQIEEKPTSTSVIVSSTMEASPKNFHEAGTPNAKEISKTPSSQDKTPRFPKISTPRDLSLTKNVNEHYLSRKDHSNLKKKLSIQEYNSRKRKSSDCKISVPEKTVKVAEATTQGGTGGLAKPSTIYSDKQFECLPTSVKDPRRRSHFANMQPAKLQRTQSEDMNTSQLQSISSSRPHKPNGTPQLMPSVTLKDPLLNSNESYTREVQNYKSYKTLLLEKSPLEKYVPIPMKISNRRKTIEVMNDRRSESAEITKKKVSFDDNVQINEVHTTQTRIASTKPEITNYCEVSSSCLDISDDKNSEDSTDLTNEDIIEESKSNAENERIEDKRKNDWEDSNSPVDSITDAFADSFLEKTRLDNLKNKNKGKLIIDISDFDTSLIDNELKSPNTGCFNSNTPVYEDAGSLQNYKEEVDSKLNSLNIQIPKTPKTRIVNEDDVLIHKFLRKEQLNSEEIKQIRRIIYFKKKMQQLTHQNAVSKNENDSYEVKKNFEHSSHKDLKLQLKKIDGRPKKKRRRFRNLYSDSPESSEGDVQGTAGEFSVYKGENISGVKLIFRRKTDLLHLQPVVRLQRCKFIESMAKKLKFE